MTDERIKSGYDKIRSEFMLIVYFAALASFIIKTVVYGANFDRNLFEFLVLVTYPLYQAVRAQHFGLAVKLDKGKVRSSFTTLFIVFALLIIYGVYKIKSTNMNTEEILGVISYLIAYIAVVTVVRILFIKHENKRFENLGKKYDDWLIKACCWINGRLYLSLQLKQ